MKYNVLKPQYFNKFKCIGSNCEDSCCAEYWDIFVDRKTYKKYMKTKNDEIGKELKDNIKRNRKSSSDYNYALFKLNDGKCAFLNDDKLCSIYINYGEDYMCNTCKEYPRIYSYVNGIIQKSLTLSCIEAARIVLLDKNIMEFDMGIEQFDVSNIVVTKKIDSKNSKNITEKYFDELRSFCIGLIQNRKFSIEERLIILGLFLSKLNNNKDEVGVVERLINEYEVNIDKGYYDNLSEKIDITKTMRTQFSILYNLGSNIVGVKLLYDKRYIEIIESMMKGFEIKKNDLENSIKIFIDIYENIYKDFIKEYEYIYENYLVNYMFTYLFPYDEHGSISEAYMNLVVNFVMIKLNAVGLCAYHKENMDKYKLVDLIQCYSKSILHEGTLNFRIQEYLKSTNQDTINHMILMIGK